jgi:hypothetical protein
MDWWMGKPEAGDAVPVAVGRDEVARGFSL